MNRHRRLSAAALAALMICTPLPSLAREAKVGKPSRLHAEPFKDAAIVETLAAAAIVEVVERKGGWSRVQHQQNEGWIRTLDLRFGKASEGSVVADTFALATGRSGSGNVVATTGIRGLDEEDLKSANFNAEQMALAESYRSESALAERTASQAGLQTSRIEYFDASSETSPAARRHDR